jgi:hippurate hydrolase
MTREPTLTPFQLLPHLLPAIDAETFVNIRRQIHAQPELGFEVGATSRLVATLLKAGATTCIRVSARAAWWAS